MFLSACVLVFVFLCFPICQVRVVRFYFEVPSPPLPPPPPPPPPRPPVCAIASSIGRIQK